MSFYSGVFIKHLFTAALRAGGTRLPSCGFCCKLIWKSGGCTFSEKFHSVFVQTLCSQTHPHGLVESGEWILSRA